MPEEKQNIQNKIDAVMTQIMKDLLLQKRWPFGIPPRGVTQKKASGNLVNSIKIRNANFNQEMTFMTFDIKALPYFSDVDKGIPRGRTINPNIILNWIKNKKLRGRDKKGKFIKDTSLVYSITKSIQNKGVKGNNIVVIFEEEVYNNPKFFELYRELFGIELTEKINEVKFD